MYSDKAVRGILDRWRTTVCSLLLCMSSLTHAQETQSSPTNKPIEIDVSPLSCIALHKKQVCYQSLEFKWPALPDGRYCLFASDQSKPVHCWARGELERLSVDYASATAVIYELRTEGSNDTLASVVIKTSWVYRTGRRSASGWRLF